MIFTVASSLATAVPTDTASLRATSAFPRASSATPVEGPATSFTVPKPASS
jgi:hypothetical protein